MQPPLENVPKKRLSKTSFRDVFAIKATKEAFASCQETGKMSSLSITIAFFASCTLKKISLLIPPF